MNYNKENAEAATEGGYISMDGDDYESESEYDSESEYESELDLNKENVLQLPCFQIEVRHIKIINLYSFPPTFTFMLL